MNSKDRLAAQRDLEKLLAESVAKGWIWERISYEDEEREPFRVHLRARLDLKDDKEQVL